MRFLRIIGVGLALGLVARWAIKSGSVPPEEERLMVCYDPDTGVPVLVPEPTNYPQ